MQPQGSQRRRRVDLNRGSPRLKTRFPGQGDFKTRPGAQPIQQDERSMGCARNAISTYIQGEFVGVLLDPAVGLTTEQGISEILIAAILIGQHLSLQLLAQE